MTAPEPIPVRPRPRSVERNGHWPVDDPLRQLTRSLEDFHIAAKALKLPPVTLNWQEADPDLSEPDAEQKALRRHVDTFLADYEGARVGPVTWPVSDIAPPERPHDFLVENLIRPGTTVMLAGPPGAAKSWASRQLAMTCAAGLPSYLDRYPVPRALNVLVIDEDNGPDEEWRREESLMAHLDLRREQLGNVRRVSLEGVQLEHESWQRWLRGQIRAHDIDLTILDPISEMHGGKELREDPAFRSVLAFLKRLKVDFPRHATVVVHHTRKRDPKATGNATLEDVRGQWGQTPDVVAMLVPMADRRGRWEVHKRVPHSSLILEQVAQGQPGEGSLKMVADEATAPTQRMQTDARVLGAIDAGAATPTEIILATELSSGGVYKAIARLADAGLITRRAPLERLDEPGELVS